MPFKKYGNCLLYAHGKFRQSVKICLAYLKSLRYPKAGTSFKLSQIVLNYIITGAETQGHTVGH